MKHICPLHPNYKAIKQPRSTDKHPGGCKTCWEVFKENRSVAMVPLKQIDLIIEVQNDALHAATVLSSAGLLVDTVLCRQNKIMGWCTEESVARLSTMEFVKSIERNG